MLLGAVDEPPPLRGYGANSRAERDWETRFRALIVPDTIRAVMRHLSARPHHVGSAYDRANALWIQARLASYGFAVQLDSFDVLFPTPLERAVELVSPHKFVAALSEPPVAGDSTSAQSGEQLPTYNAYSIDGDVTAPLVYVNYGVPADYDRLERFGVSVRGAIVIARYGAAWRGVKPKLAAEHGAIGCLIYSDPHEDGYHAGDVFPAGPWRPAAGVQRGSVMDITLHPGDPLTPGVGGRPGAPRLALKDAETLTKIPVLPLSYGDAEPLLAALGGTVAPPEWRGGLGLTYHLGPGPAVVHLRVRSDWSLHRIYDIIARIPGATNPGEWIIRGNHYDAWVNGAWDPLAGQSALLEEARGLGELLRQGWRPKRTIIYAAWDGEEPGLLGSTAWVEAHADELADHAVAYLNTDTNGRVFLTVGGSHSLEAFINGVERDVIDPETGLTVWKRAQLVRIARADEPERRRELREQGDLHIDAIGSGSDYTAFLDHAGIASLNLGFEGEDRAQGIYHSVYDDFYWFTHFGDTAFVYGRALAQTVGTAVMRLADADVLPFAFRAVADNAERYTGELRDLWASEVDEARERNLELAEGVFTATADPQVSSAVPPAESVPPHLDFAPLENGSDALARSVSHYEQALAEAAEGGALDHPGLDAVNDLLRRAEQALTNPAGLPGRPWYRHVLYAPGRYTGYAAKTVPGVREAIEARRWPEADAQAEAVGSALGALAAVIDSASVALGRLARP